MLSGDFYLSKLVRNMWNGEVNVCSGIRQGCADTPADLGLRREAYFSPGAFFLFLRTSTMTQAAAAISRMP